MGEGKEVFVLDMGKPIKILDLAREMIRLSGLEPDKDVPIVFSGTRPGEKLFEEILTAGEGVNATKQKKIFTAKISSDMSIDSFENILNEIKKVVEEKNKERLNEYLKEIIPSFSPLKDH
jgi:FlaA1/EpsC-like NDP-sugar epimerase